ncbi:MULTISPECIES: hypothetical protein [unclassified Campylobacter]|uniref:hypothetical protein n=1 Tax=unclassified Campylobacter TaxID=2593542 RepID=UPI0022E9F992|nr:MULTISPECIES: hypothetical protein [unclassified Campylobacter]MDA3042638.1 hypothetical protein [Campylobacter sp. JMF_09 ED2]MDA3044548.1 hypothetical protein [Campylobacter sp. JMF_07 ED4]MDA3063329.1 hypothetical protein [Campylobacter sp. JMF_11 EL3]MDA3071525.1 hypothetical protein [Campylobacter sp. VBCF_03 NA9]MDA3074411.1 hypothetical protein [Campylobacter sp. JMF_05 ED3]
MLDIIEMILGYIIPYELFLYMPFQVILFVFFTWFLMIISLFGILISAFFKRVAYKKILIKLLKITMLFMWLSFIISYCYYCGYVASYGISQVHIYKPVFYLFGIVIVNILVYLYMISTK